MVGVATRLPVAPAQQMGCEVTIPGVFRLLETQDPRSGGPTYPANTRVRAITFGTASQGRTRAVRVRIESAEGWVFLWPSQLRACPPGSVAQRPGDVIVARPDAGVNGGNSNSSIERSATSQVTRACVPNSTQACLCPGNVAGVQSCDPSGMAYTPCGCASPSTPPEPPSIAPRTCAANGDPCNPGIVECCSGALRCRGEGSDPLRLSWFCRPCGGRGQTCCRRRGSHGCQADGCSSGLNFDPYTEVCQ